MRDYVFSHVYVCDAYSEKIYCNCTIICNNGDALLGRLFLAILLVVIQICEYLVLYIYQYRRQEIDIFSTCVRDLISFRQSLVYVYPFGTPVEESEKFKKPTLDIEKSKKGYPKWLIWYIILGHGGVIIPSIIVIYKCLGAYEGTYAMAILLFHASLLYILFELCVHGKSNELLGRSGIDVKITRIILSALRVAIILLVVILYRFVFAEHIWLLVCIIVCFLPFYGDYYAIIRYSRNRRGFLSNVFDVYIAKQLMKRFLKIDRECKQLDNILFENEFDFQDVIKQILPETKHLSLNQNSKKAWDPMYTIEDAYTAEKGSISLFEAFEQMRKSYKG